MSNPSAAFLIDTLGAKRIAERVGKGQPSVSIAKRGIPARWYPLVREMCAEDGIDCPEDAFNWARPQETGTAL
jgi:hypothetical protein